MTKKEIVKQIADRAALTQLQTKEIVQWTFDAIVDTLIRDGRIELRNFGVFEVKRRKARKARNPRTGAKVDVEPKNVVTFKPGKEMEERVSKMTNLGKAAKPSPRKVVRPPEPILVDGAPSPLSVPDHGLDQREPVEKPPMPRPRKVAQAAAVTEVP